MKTAQSSDIMTNESETVTEVDSTSHEGVSAIDRHVETDLTSADTVTFIKEQTGDATLQKYFETVRKDNTQFFIRDGIFYHRGNVN